MGSWWMAVMPEVILGAGGLTVFCVGAFRGRRSDSLLFSLALAAACGGLIAAVAPPAGAELPGVPDAGAYGRFFAILSGVVTIFTLLLSREYARSRGFSGDEFYGILLMADLGMVLLSGANHWLILFLGFELLSISLYVLVGIHRRDSLSNEAALKYLLMGAVAGAFLTFGIAMVFSASGKMGIADSLGAGGGVERGGGLVLGLSLLVIGMGFKLSLVPLHLWTPDVYQGAPLPVTAFLSTGSKAAVMAALLKIVLVLDAALWEKMLPVLWGMAALTILLGNITALVQNYVKRLLAYSSVAQMGYVLMGLVAVRDVGAESVLFYLVVYVLMDLGAFGALALLSGKEEDLGVVADCAGLGWRHPWRAALLTVSLFSLAGFPPTGGFIGKLMLFQATIGAGFPLLAVIGIVGAIVSVYFYLKVVVALYMRPAVGVDVAMTTDASGWTAIIGLGGLLLLLGIAPSPTLTLITGILATP